MTIVNAMDLEELEQKDGELLIITDNDYYVQVLMFTSRQVGNSRNSHT